jgi:hypothetical protein
VDLSSLPGYARWADLIDVSEPVAVEVVARDVDEDECGDRVWYSLAPSLVEPGGRRPWTSR